MPDDTKPPMFGPSANIDPATYEPRAGKTFWFDPKDNGHRIARGAPSNVVGRLRPGGRAAPIGWRGKRRQPAAGFSRPACPAAGCTA